MTPLAWSTRVSSAGAGTSRTASRRACAPWLALATALVSFVTAACVSTDTATFTEPTTGRPYRVVTTRGHDATRPAPLLYALHAYATSPDVLVDGWGLRGHAAARGYVLVVPEGRTDSDGNRFWNATRACCGSSAAKPDDVAYLRAVHEDVRRRYGVDPTRVLALGVSNGGFMAHRWACEPRSPLTGIVSVSGAGPGEGDPPCTPLRAVAVLEVHGDADDVVRIEGGELNGVRHPSARASLAPYLHGNGSAPQPVVTREVGGNWFRAVRREDFGGGAAPVALWTVEGGGHRLSFSRREVDAWLDFVDRARR